MEAQTFVENVIAKALRQVEEDEATLDAKEDLAVAEEEEPDHVCHQPAEDVSEHPSDKESADMNDDRASAHESAKGSLTKDEIADINQDELQEDTVDATTAQDENAATSAATSEHESDKDEAVEEGQSMMRRSLPPQHMNL
ncbi:unnamed protein product [Pleuronectes platessa]|uniref:Uncharacterized protein n=1 Tax=Pleuronectes platessa TaxID=8262 RepID=A0A9N7YDH6_PLEPL|nr:unnamed protein product [Pleuronectes platessa]